MSECLKVDPETDSLFFIERGFITLTRDPQQSTTVRREEASKLTKRAARIRWVGSAELL